MSIFSSAYDFLEGVFKPKSERSEEAQIAIEDLEKNIWCYELALHLVTEKIAALCSNIEWKTFVKNEVKRGENWYLFNNEPNPNQTGVEFKKQLFTKLAYDRECLVVQVGKSIYVADSFNKVFPTATLGEVTFNGVVINLMDEQEIALDMTFDSHNSIYMRYQKPTVEALYVQLTNLYADLIENTIIAGSSKVKYALKIDATASRGLNIDYGEVTRRLINEDFKKLATDKNVILPLYNGFELQQLNAGNNLAQNASIGNKGIIELLNSLVEYVAKAYGIAPDIVNGKGSEEEYTSSMTFGIDPMVTIVEKAFNKGYYGRQIYKGFRLEISTTNARHFEILRAGSAFSQLISSGVESINDIREMLGQELVDPEVGDKHWITRNYAVAGSFIQEQEEVAKQESEGEEVSAVGGGLK